MKSISYQDTSLFNLLTINLSRKHKCPERKEHQISGFPSSNTSHTKTGAVAMRSWRRYGVTLVRMGAEARQQGLRDPGESSTLSLSPADLEEEWEVARGVKNVYVAAHMRTQRDGASRSGGRKHFHA